MAMAAGLDGGDGTGCVRVVGFRDCAKTRGTRLLRVGVVGVHVDVDG